MRIAIIGGTGTLGRAATAHLRARGHEVRVLSRRAERYRVDLTTGDGLDAALEGCDALVDASNNADAKKARPLLVDGTRRLAAAGLEAGVRHHVAISIVGCEKVQIGYFKVKVDQEHEVARGGLPWTVVRATQFHDFVAQNFAAVAKFGVLPLLRVPMQPVAVADVARAVADAVESGPRAQHLEAAASGPRAGRVDVAGPEVLDARDLARMWQQATGGRVLPVRVPIPGNIGRALRAGALTADRADVLGTTTYAAWLESEFGKG
jgi:uncharacterized protein YbjT (DUF2867 family)